jgi:hypothetical protein
MKRTNVGQSEEANPADAGNVRHPLPIASKEHMKLIQKLIITGTLIAAVGIVALAANQPASKTDTSYDSELDRKITEVWFDCQKIHPGITRADLDKMFRRETGGVAVPESTPLPFQEHQTFGCRRCDHIMIDVDFRPSDSKEERPTDVMIKVSTPYIDCSPKV